MWFSSRSSFAQLFSALDRLVNSISARVILASVRADYTARDFGLAQVVYVCRRAPVLKQSISENRNSCYMSFLGIA
jgi:hypothetical protein